MGRCLEKIIQRLFNILTEEFFPTVKRAYQMPLITRWSRRHRSWFCECEDSPPRLRNDSPCLGGGIFQSQQRVEHVSNIHSRRYGILSLPRSRNDATFAAMYIKLYYDAPTIRGLIHVFLPVLCAVLISLLDTSNHSFSLSRFVAISAQTTL